jgi:hypothetical protein
MVLIKALSVEVIHLASRFQEKGLIDAAAAYQQLTTKTNSRCSPELHETFLQRVRALGKNRS